LSASITASLACLAFSRSSTESIAFFSSWWRAASRAAALVSGSALGVGARSQAASYRQASSSGVRIVDPPVWSCGLCYAGNRAMAARAGARQCMPNAGDSTARPRW
jgi:hypothetical protein